MRQNGFFATYGYPFLAAFFLCGAGGLFFNSRFGMQMNEFVLLMAIALFILIVQLFDVFKRRVWVSLLFAVYLLAAVGLLCYFILSSYHQLMQIGTGKIFREYSVFVWWKDYNPATGFDYNFDYALITVSIYVLLAGLGSYFIQKGFTARVLSAIGLVAGVVVLISYQTEIPWLALVFLLAYLSSVLIEVCFRFVRRKTPQKRFGSAVSAFLLPVTLVISLVITWLPLNEDPIDWSFVTEPLQGINLWVGELIPWGSGPEGTAGGKFTTGYSDANGDLGGDLQQKTGTALSVKFDTPPYSGVYLSGSTRDTYTGRRWEDNAEPLTGVSESYNESVYDGAELLYALNSSIAFEDGMPLEYIYGNTATITYRNVWTPSVFLPPKTYREIETANNLPITNNSGGTGTAFTEPRRDASYTTSYLEINYNNDELVSIFRDFGYIKVNREVFLDERVRELTKLGARTNIQTEDLIQTDFLLNLANRYEWICNTYLHLPSSLPSRVRDLAFEITEGLDNDYDRLKAIETYLSTNYEYTHTPGTVPEGYDFADYFLFEKPEGYCTYFATSMTVLARCVGIPTRYVEGYAARLDTKAGADEYAVLHQEAHAWPEAYIYGFGWIPFEPTSTRQANRYAEWPDSQVPNPEPTGPEQPNKPDSDISQNETSQPDGQSEEQTGQATAILVTIAVLFAGLVLTALLAMVLLRQRRKKRYASSSLEEKIRLDFKDILLLLEACSYKLEPGETLAAYSRRIATAYRGSYKLFARAEQVYSRLYYSSGTVTQDEYDLVRFTRETFLRETRDQTSTLQFLRLKNKLQKF